MDNNRFEDEYKKMFEKELKLLEERDPYYKKFSSYVHIYNALHEKDRNDNHLLENNKLIMPVIAELRKLSVEEKAEIIELFDTKIQRKKDKEKYDDIVYYKNMYKHFMEHCI